MSPSCWCCGRYAQAEALLAALPPPLRERPELRHLRAHAGFLDAARAAPDPQTLEHAIAVNPATSRRAIGSAPCG